MNQEQKVFLCDADPEHPCRHEPAAEAILNEINHRWNAYEKAKDLADLVISYGGFNTNNETAAKLTSIALEILAGRNLTEER